MRARASITPGQSGGLGVVGSNPAAPTNDFNKLVAQRLPHGFVGQLWGSSRMDFTAAK
jgi:hypothetical protein